MVLTMNWSGLAKFIIGLILALSVLIGGSVATALYFMSKVTAPPPKPVFANDKATVKASRPPDSKTTERTTANDAKPIATPTITETPSLKPLEPGAYRARVSWSEGLILRSAPYLDAERIGGIEYNQQIVVLEESPDKSWQRIRLENNQQGWIKAGNTERVETEE